MVGEKGEGECGGGEGGVWWVRREGGSVVGEKGGRECGG